MTYFLSFIYGAALFYVYRFFPFISIFLSLITPLLFFRRTAIRYSLLVVIIAASGFYYARLSYIQASSFSDIAGKTLEIEGRAKTEAVSLNPQAHTFAQVVDIKKAVDENDKQLNLKGLRLVSNSILGHDRLYLIKARIPRDSYFLNPGGNKNLISGHADSIEEIGSTNTGFFEKSRLRLNGFIKSNFSSESAPFLMSIITGERSLLTKETRNAFNATGLAHILSISGAHFGLLLFILFRLFRFLIKMLPYKLLVRLTLYLTPSQIAAILCIPFMIGYLGISDMSIPSIRAFIMITLFLFGLLIHRKGFWLNTLLFAAVVIVLIQPDSIIDLSFQLSFIAVLCIGIVIEHRRNGVMESWSDGDKRNGVMEHWSVGDKKQLVRRSIASLLHHSITPLLISLVATIGTAPLVTYHFHYFSLISPVTNLIITPIIGFVILPASLVSSFVFLIFGVFPLYSSIDKFTNFILAAIKYIAQWSFVDIKIPAFPLILLIMFYLGILLYVFLRGNRQWANVKGHGSWRNSCPLPLAPTNNASRLLPVALPVVISVVPVVLYASIKLFEHKGISITYLDVGQGDSAVVELPDNKTLVIDTGRKGFQTGEFLKYRGIKNIDAIVLSHGQSDHAGGIWHLTRNFKVNEVWDNGRLIYPQGFPANISGNIKHVRLQRGDVAEGSGYKIIALHPYDGFYTMHSRDSDENNDSIVLKIQGNKNSFLFAGDIEEEPQEDLSHLQTYIKSTVLKFPHHGSRSSASEVFLNTVSPEIAVISVGRKNIYGHPHDETLEMLSRAKIFRTDIDGAVGIRELSDGRLEVKTWKDMQLAEASSIKEELMNFKKLFLVW